MRKLLLDSRRLEGQHPVWREIGTYLQAVVVSGQALDDAVAAIEYLLQLWGGGAAPLIPVKAPNSEPAGIWRQLLDSGRVDEVVPRGHYSTDDLCAELCGVRLGAFDHDPLYIPLSSQIRQGTNHSVSLGLPRRDDPWFVSYLATFGSLPASPEPDLLYHSGISRDVDFADLIEIERETVEEPDGQDLLGRLQTERNPRDMSLFGMAYRLAPWSQDLQAAPTWTSEGWTAQHCGSNIAVVYEPGSVRDLCLLWTLRAAHGYPRGFPLGVPVNGDVAAELEAWTDRDNPYGYFAAKLRGFGRPFALTSLSVAQDVLATIAAAVPFGDWQAIDAAELIQPPGRPSIRSADIASFTNGRAQVTGWDQETRELLRSRSPGAFGPNLHVRISLQDRPLPPLASLRLGDRALAPAWRDGGFDTQLPRQPGETVSVEWPSGFAVLQAAAATHGLQVRPSQPGRVAEAFLRRLGDLAQVDPLKDAWLLGEIDRLTERRGIRWFRQRMRRVTTELDEKSDERLAAVERQIEELRIAGANPDDAHDLTAADLTRGLGRPAAHRWLEWAEDHGLLVRGTEIRCDECNARSWRTADELGPPIVCPGCGETVKRPFRPDHLPFRYRASQALTDVMADDALPHLLCASWWAALMGDGLYGIHPGVEFLDGDEVSGEADVVLLLPNGRIALGEVKSRGAGLTAREVERFETLADRVDALWTFYATPQYAAQCPEIWQQLRRDLPERRAFALTGEHLLELSWNVHSLMGVDATAWTPSSEDDQRARSEFFRARIADVIDHLQEPDHLDRLIGLDGQ